MDIFTVALIVLALILLQGVTLYFVLRRRPATAVEDSGGMVLLQQQVESLRQSVDLKLGEGNKQVVESLRTQFAQSQQLVKNIEERVSSQLLEVAKGMAKNEESTKQVFTIAEQLHNLESILKNQKQRGNLGEASLELILSNVLPGQYKTQYKFKDGKIVDFVIETKEGLIPIDAKFPLENYIRLSNETDEKRRQQYERDFKNDVKEKVDQTAQYIRPEEGTLPFAFMYIPAEGIFSDLMNNEVGTGVNSQDLMEYARYKRNVHITSPATFLAFLQTVLFGNQRMKIQDAAKDIIKNVSELGRHLKSYEAAHNGLGKSLSAAVGHYEISGKAFRAIPKDVLKITEESLELKIETIDRPLLPEA
ncbi:MAG: DNA recombination protein RmuC [Candidatus Paceibacterota bacterium]